MIFMGRMKTVRDYSPTLLRVTFQTCDHISEVNNFIFLQNRSVKVTCSEKKYVLEMYNGIWADAANAEIM